jgi:hypothetical protein
MNPSLERSHADTEPDYIRINVSEMAAPEPMQTILLALQAMPSHGVLIVNHSREPFPLYSVLKQHGFDYDIRSSLTGFLIFIWHQAFCFDLAMIGELKS